MGFQSIWKEKKLNEFLEAHCNDFEFKEGENGGQLQVRLSQKSTGKRFVYLFFFFGNRDKKGYLTQ